MFNAIADIGKAIGGIFNPVAKLIDDVKTSDEERLILRNEFEKLRNIVTLKWIELEGKRLEYESKLTKAQSAIIMAEIKHGTWMQKNWRPGLMFLFGIIIFNNYMLAPYLQAIFGWGVQMVVPIDMWDLIKIFSGGYVLGRSAEKISETGGIKSIVGKIFK